MKWYLVFSILFLLTISEVQACQAPESASSLALDAQVIAARTAVVEVAKSVNKALARVRSCELPTVVGENGQKITLDVKRLQKNEYPLNEEFAHPGKKLIGRAGNPKSPKGSPRDPSKLQQSRASANEDELSEEEAGSPSYVMQQRRSTFSE